LTGFATVTDAVPFAAVHIASVEALVTDGPVDVPTVTLAEAVQLAPLVTVTVYVPAVRPLIVAVVPCPPLHTYVGLLGLLTVTVAEPLLPPHDVVTDDVLSDGALDAATDTLAVAEHPLLLTVTVYVPDATLLMLAVVPAPPLQLYVGLTGLVMVTDAPPLLSPQDVAVAPVLSDTPVDEATDTLAVAEHPLLLTVTVYVPDATLLMLAPVPAPPLQL